MEGICEVTTPASIASCDALNPMTALRDRREPFAAATVIEMQGSASAKTGSKAVIGRDGRVAAWVGGGCAEATACLAALDSIETGETTIVDLDLNDEVLGTGMSCGGTIRVFIEPFRPKRRLWILDNGKVAETLCAIQRSPVPCIALIASRKRSKLVIDYPCNQGLGEAALARAYASARLESARAPEEIALSILGEIVMLRHKASGAPRRHEMTQTERRS